MDIARKRYYNSYYGKNSEISTVDVGEGGEITFASVLSGDGTLRKTGAGTLTISGANTFTGGIELNAGTLKLENASAAGKGGITIASNGMLRLDDTLTVTDFTWDGTWLEGIASATDLGFINADSVTFGEDAILSLDILDFALEDGDEFAILKAVSYTVEEGFAWNTLLDESLLSNWNLKLVNQSLTLTYTAIPEPSTWMMLVLGATALVFIRRKW